MDRWCLGRKCGTSRRLQSLEITIGVEVDREVVTELKLSVEEEEEIKSREKNGGEEK